MRVGHIRKLGLVASLAALLAGGPSGPQDATAAAYRGLTVGRVQAIFEDPENASRAEWAAIDQAISDAGGRLAYGDEDASSLLSTVVRESRARAAQAADTPFAFASKVRHGPCTGYPSAPHRRTDSPAAAYYNVGFKPRISCTEPMNLLNHTSVLFRLRATGIVGSDRMAVRSGSSYGESSYTDKRPVWDCSSSKRATWRVIYQYGYQKRGCTCRPVQYFVVKSEYKSLACRGI